MLYEMSCDIYYNGERYPIVIAERELTIPLENYGMRPGYVGFHRRYICSLEITDGLYVNKLTFCETNDRYLPIDGVPPHLLTRMQGPRLFSKPRPYAYYFGLRMKLPYSGKLLLGKPVSAQAFLHGGEEWPWNADRLYELQLDNGDLVSVADRSDVASQMREAIHKCRPSADAGGWDEWCTLEEPALPDALYLALEPLQIPLWWLYMAPAEGTDEQQVRDSMRAACQQRQQEEANRLKQLLEQYDFLIHL